MAVTHNLGYPRIGAQRELKQALESYWRAEIGAAHLEGIGQALRARHWQQQADAGVDWIPVGDFSFYDHILDWSVTLGVIPERFVPRADETALDTCFRMARGRAPGGEPAAACEMTKWFDSNYHYIVPEFSREQAFCLASERLFDQVAEAQALGHRVKAVVPGPLTYLWLGKMPGTDRDKLRLLDRLLPVYAQILARLTAQGVQWVQFDEPILSVEMDADWQAACGAAYQYLTTSDINLLVANYFGGLEENLPVLLNLPVAGIHIDGVRAPEEIAAVAQCLNATQILSCGIIDGRNIWRTDPDAALGKVRAVAERLGQRLWLAPNCSLLHVPVDLDSEEHLDPDIVHWLAFAKQKLAELHLLRRALDNQDAVVDELALLRSAMLSRSQSPRIHQPQVKQRIAGVDAEHARRHAPFCERNAAQRTWLKLPLFPTTTIGSFPQTAEIRAARRRYKNGEIDETAYRQAMRAEIARVIGAQEKLGLDVLVHGEPERNDMVEYFGEQLQGFAFTTNGWVQSYGSRCVKPPIIYGDISRPRAITVDWINYAQSLTAKPVKGMLTGPVTILNWSFVRDDVPRADTCLQIVLALRDEVLDLEKSGVGIIQIDEAALREGLPLRRKHWVDYLHWAIQSFKVMASGVADTTQIHTHMCYSNFNDIIDWIAAMDADVITIETSRSRMELLGAFENFAYPNDIGPGVYDIHSPNIPSTQAMVALLEEAVRYIPQERLWVNPDCGLKTRAWPEVESALEKMVTAAIRLREVRGATTS